MKKILLYYHTLKHLKWIQIYYQLWYPIKWKILKPKFNKYKKFEYSTYHWEVNLDLLPVESGLFSKNSFRFLNKEQTFAESIDWTYLEFGKLWNYQLQYMTYLLDDSKPQAERTQLLQSISMDLLAGKVSLEPYPVSLRLMNSLIFCCKYQIKDNDIKSAIGLQFGFLENNIEYHILANHILCNYIALCFCSIHIQDVKRYNAYFHKLESQLRQQIFNDGGHYERSPMYHAQILYQLLLLLYVMDKCSFAQKDLPVINNFCCNMLSWYKRITLDGKLIPLFNDTVKSLSPEYLFLKRFATVLGIQAENCVLTDSGFRIFKKGRICVILNCGVASPSYQPGHAHADILSFIMTVDDKPVLVDPGISTYENGETRSLQKSSSYHNTVSVAKENQSQVWMAFRMGKRARLQILQDEAFSFKAKVIWHTGLVHSRSFTLDQDSLILVDSVSDSKLINNNLRACLHFDYRCRPEISGQNIVSLSDSQVSITIEGHQNLVLAEYLQAEDFNKQNCAIKLSAYFAENLKTQISWKT